MTTLLVAQTIFYIIASLAILVVGVFLAVALYHSVGTMRNVRNISADLADTSRKTKETIATLIDSLSGLPILPYFLKKRERKVYTKKKKSLEEK